MKSLCYLFIGILLLGACSSNNSTAETASEFSDMAADTSTFVEFNNPPAEGFNQEGSDLLATILADKVMQAMGGRTAWDNARYLSWSFFGNRTHIWDKWTGDVRIEVPSRELIILMNINSKEGKVQRAGDLVTDSLDFYLNAGYGFWVNDAYWLAMPYKLKDSGVTLRYLREDTTQLGKQSDVIGLSFESTGLTPQNRYDVWIDADSKLVTQWAYYPDSTTLEPMFVTPWADYKQYGEIMLSGNRGQYNLEDIQVMQEVPEETFASF